MEQNGQNTPPAREEDRLPPNITRRRGSRRTRAEPTPEERAEAEALMARIMAPRYIPPAVPYLEQLLGQRGPDPNVTQRRPRTPRAPRAPRVPPGEPFVVEPIPFRLPDEPPQPADDVNELLGAFRQFMNNLEEIRIVHINNPYERSLRITELVNNYFRQRNLIVQLQITRLAQQGQTLPENYREQAINEFLEIVDTARPGQPIGVNRFIRQAQAQAQAQVQAEPLQPTGVAFEIHIAFTKFQSIKNAYLELIAEPDNEYGNIINYIYENYYAIIGQIFPNNAVEKRKQLKKVIKKIMDSRFDEYKDLIGKTVSFVTKQDNNFKEQYILAFLNDTCNAYATGTDRTSCVKGIIERIVLSVGSAVQVLCTGDDDDNHCENVTYQKLNALMNPKFKVEDAANSWFETAETNQEIREMVKAGRKNNFIEYLKSEAIRLDHKDGVIPENIMADIMRYAETMDYAFEDLQLGGARKSRKSKKSRKSRKSRKSKKSRKSRKSRKSKK